MTSSNDDNDNTHGPMHIGDVLGPLMDQARRAIEANGGWATPEPEGSEAERRAAEIAERRGLLKALGIPDKVAGVLAAGDLAETKALLHAQRFVRERDRLVLVLTGQKDASKSTAAGYAVSVWPTPRRLERWPRFLAFEHVLSPWYHRPSEACPRDELTRMTRRDILQAELLVLDDVGQEPADLAHRCGEALDQILKARCDAGLYTIITTNDLESEHMCGRYEARGPRITERIVEFGVWGRCPHEGLRDLNRRRAVLAAREQGKAR